MRNGSIRHAERLCVPEKSRGKKTIKKRTLKCQRTNYSKILSGANSEQ